MACIDPIQVKIGDKGGNLVVEGLITDQPGPYFVNLTISGSYQQNDARIAATGAIVSISDDTGISQNLNEIKPGVYATDSVGITGVVGRTYKIKIKYNAKEYESYPEKLIQFPQHRKINFEFKKGVGARTEGIYTSVEIEDPANERNYYRWDYTGHQVYLRFYDSPTDPYLGERTIPCVSTEICAGCVNIFSDKFSDGKTFSQQIIIVPYISRKKYLLKLRQYSLSKNAYEFWLEVNRQSNNKGTLFDPPPQQVRGNIQNIKDEEEVVLGYFGASDMVDTLIAVPRNNIPFPLTYPPRIPRQCTEGPICSSAVIPPPVPPCPELPPPYWNSEEPGE